MVHPLIGKKAPEVTLPDANGEPYDLKPGASGRPLALFFYPAAGKIHPPYALEIHV